MCTSYCIKCILYNCINCILYENWNIPVVHACVHKCWLHYYSEVCEYIINILMYLSHKPPSLRRQYYHAVWYISCLHGHATKYNQKVMSHYWSEVIRSSRYYEYNGTVTMNILHDCMTEQTLNSCFHIPRQGGIPRNSSYQEEIWTSYIKAT